jgi:hypothetical protein
MNAAHNSGPSTEELRKMDDPTRIAVIGVQIGHISETLTRIENAQVGTVSRTEWEQRNAYSDRRFNELEARRAPWWTIIGAGAGFIAIIAFAFDIIPKIAN